jgi:DNA-binding MarR family transcriptional regulator
MIVVYYNFSGRMGNVLNKVEQRAKLERSDIVKFQLLTYCFFKGVELTGNELECLALLAQTGECELNRFCKSMEDSKLYASAQTVRNVINKFEKKELVVKEGRKHKRLNINPEMRLQTSGNILLDLKFACIV